MNIDIGTEHVQVMCIVTLALYRYMGCHMAMVSGHMTADMHSICAASTLHPSKCGFAAVGQALQRYALRPEWAGGVESGNAGTDCRQHAPAAC